MHGTCKECKAVFLNFTQGQKYCSPNCRQAAKNKSAGTHWSNKSATVHKALHPMGCMLFNPVR